MANLFALITKRNHLRRTGALAQDIASQSVGDVWDRVAGLVLDMDLPEARGYTRVRAVKVIRRHVSRLAQQRHLDGDAQQLLFTLATERVVQLVVADLASGRTKLIRAAA